MDEIKAAERLAAEIAKPFEADAGDKGFVDCDDEFDPWSLFPSLYGSYSSDFDDCALDVLRELQAKTPRRDDLGAMMFREMLCTGGFCDYGTSPRVCFWALDSELLDQLISRWAEWSARQWSQG